MGIFGWLSKESEEDYIDLLAKTENLIKQNDDFYGFILEGERAKLEGATHLSVPNLILGLIYLVGINVSRNPNKAANYFNRSIELGTGFADKYLGALEGQRNNRKKSLEYLEKGVSFGDPDAMLMLGYYYAYEITLEGGQPDNKKARVLYQKAANMGHEGAKQNIAYMDEDGR